MDMAVKSPSPSVHNPLLGDLPSPHNPLGIQVSKGVDTGFVNSNSKTDEGTEVARQVSHSVLGFFMVSLISMIGLGLCGGAMLPRSTRGNDDGANGEQLGGHRGHGQRDLLAANSSPAELRPR